MKSTVSRVFGIAGAAAFAMLAGIGVSSAQTGTASLPVSTGLEVTPYIIAGANPGGNRTCAEAGKALTGDAEYYSCRSGRVNYDEDTGLFDGGFQDISGNDDCYRNMIGVDVDADGTYFSFNANPDGVGAAIVKGSAAANVYFYVPQATADAGLAAPLNASGEPAGLSNLTFCWNPEEPQLDECYEGETAWAAGSRYVSRGNWATYTSYSGVEKTVTLFAGQTMEAGTVEFAPYGINQVEITVTLNTGWRFALNPVDEDAMGAPIYDDNLKVQDYATAPSGNPAPGLFAHKKFVDMSPASIVVPSNNFYGVHVDVEQRVVCSF